MTSIQKGFDLFCIISICLLLLVMVVSKRGLLDLQRIKRQTEHLVVKIQEAKKVREQLRTDINSLQNDPKFQERTVRETLGYIRPNELVVEFP